MSSYIRQIALLSLVAVPSAYAANPAPVAPAEDRSKSSASTDASRESNAPSDQISMEQATKIATDMQPGTVLSKELEEEDGKWVYSFDIRSADQKLHEIQLDAKNGKLVSHEVETLEQEAGEEGKGYSE